MCALGSRDIPLAPFISLLRAALAVAVFTAAPRPPWLSSSLTFRRSMHTPPSWAKTINLELAAPREKRSGKAWGFALDSPFVCLPGTPVCEDIAVLEAAEFGIVVLDQDFTEHDLILAGIVYPPGKSNEQLSGLQPFMGKLPLRPQCEREFCFLDETSGVAGFKITTMEQVPRGLLCEPLPISGQVGVTPTKSALGLEFFALNNSCDGPISLWDFGDTTQEESTARAEAAETEITVK